MLLNNYAHAKDSSLDALKIALINLENSEIKYNELYHSMKEPVAINEVSFDALGMPVNYRMIDVNASFFNYFKIDKESLLGKSFEELFDLNNQEFWEPYSKALASKEVYSFEVFFAPMSKYLKISVFEISENTFVSVFRDVTASKIEENIAFSNSEYLCKLNLELEDAKKEMEIALREAESSKVRFNSLINAYDKKVYICSKDYDLEDTNVSYLSKAINNSLSDKCYKLIHGADKPCSWCPIQKVYQEKKVVTLEYTINENTYRLVASSLGEANNNSIMLIITDITGDRKIVTEAIESYQNLKAIYESSLDGIAVINKHGKVVLWNNSAEKELYYNETEMLGRNILDIVPERYHKSFKAEFEEFKQTTKTAFYGNPVIISALKKGGEEIKIELSLSSLKSKGETLLLAIFRSNYNRNSVVNVKDDGFYNIKSIYEKALVPVILLDDNAKIQYLNKSAQKTFGITSSAEPNMSIYNIIKEDSHSLFKDNFEDYISCKSTYTANEPVLLKLVALDKNCFNADMIIYPLVIENMKKILVLFNIQSSFLMGANNDFSKYLKLFDSNLYSYLMINKKGKVSYWSKGAEILFGYNQSDIVDQSPLKLLPVRHRSYFEEKLVSFCLDGKLDKDLKEFETTLIKNDSQEIIAKISINKIEIDGEFYACTVIKDITDKKVLEDRLDKLKMLINTPDCPVDGLEPFEKILNYSNNSNLHFLSLMSHELRSPLNAILGFADLLNKQYYGQMNDKQLEYVRLISSSGNLLLTFINDMLDIAKVDSGTLDFNLDSIDALKAVDTVMTIMKSQFESKNIILTKEINVSELLILTDKSKLKQILINLLSNALKFTDSGGKVTVKFDVKDDKYAMFSVVDTGCGVKDEDQNKIFNEFYQADKKRDQALGGAGIGLSLVNRLVKIHGGELGVESKIGKGSVFWFTLPLANKVE